MEIGMFSDVIANILDSLVGLSMPTVKFSGLGI